MRPLTEEEASVIICAAESEAGYKEAMRLVESRADTLTDSDYANAIVAQHDYMLGLLTGEANT